MRIDLFPLNSFFEYGQARATKLIPELTHLSYEERLKKLRMPTLKARRIKLDLVQAYKILHGFDIKTILH